MTSAIVIGGGIAGCSTAYALAKSGIAVTLIERHEKLAQEASGNPIAVLYPKISTKPDAASTLALQGFAFTLTLLKQLPANEKIFDACGLIQLAFNARETARLLMLGEQKHVQILSAKAASEMAGITLKSGGLYFPQSGWLKPQALCEALCNHILIKKFTSTNALTIEKISSQWLVNNTFAAENVVICNANDIKQFQQCNSAEITPVRGQVNFFAESAQSQNLKTIICSDHFISPAVDGWHSFGTSYAANDMNAEVSAQDTANNLAALRKISPELLHQVDAKTIQARVAWRSQTLDYMPLAGQLLDEKLLRENPPRYNAAPESLPWLQGLYVNAGHGSKGMITAPLCGELLANLMTKTAFPMHAKLASKLNPSRFLLKQIGLKQLANSLYI